MPFTPFNLNPKLLQALGDLGFTAPTPIQKLAIPPLMEGRDALGAAATGSGKTAAFLLPILHAIMDKPRGRTRALVLAPTRELAAQIVEHFNELAAHTPLKAAAVYGGVGMEPQVRAFERGVDLIAACPGRLLDHFQYPYARLEHLEYLVLDEADRMLDMGFLPDVRRILRALPARKQTMLFSATMPPPIVQLSKEMLKDPVALNIERKSAPAAGIRHAAFPVPEELKKYLLLQLLTRPESTSVLAFTRTKHRANRLADFLGKSGVSCERIHGNRSQLQRTEALKGFKGGRYQVLVATDIAARGIDVEPVAAGGEPRPAGRAARLRASHRPYRPGWARRAGHLAGGAGRNRPAAQHRAAGQSAYFAAGVARLRTLAARGKCCARIASADAWRAATGCFGTAASRAFLARLRPGAGDSRRAWGLMSAGVSRRWSAPGAVFTGQPVVAEHRAVPGKGAPGL